MENKSNYKSNENCYSNANYYSHANYYSNANYYSMFNKKCYGVYKSIFCYDEKGIAFMIFNKQSNFKRYLEIYNKISDFLNEWKPEFTNYNYLKENSLLNKETVEGLDNDKAHLSMPQEMIDYIVLLEEFDAEIFKEITGIDVSQPKSCNGKIVEIDGKKYKLSEV